MHTTKALHTLDMIRVRGFPVTSGARTIVDLCACRLSEDKLSATIGSAMRGGFTSEPFLRKRLALRGPGRHGVRFLDKVLGGPIAHSHLERAFLTLSLVSAKPTPGVDLADTGEECEAAGGQGC